MPALASLDGEAALAVDYVNAISLADAARDSRDWLVAADYYRLALKALPGDAGLWVQLGHSVKEGGDPAAAEMAYRRALAIDASIADTHLQLGHVLKIQGQREAAIAAYTHAARLDPHDASARRELVHLGRRDALPDAATESTAMWERLSAVAAALADGAVARREWIAGAAYPLAAYDRFRRDIPVRPPPGALPAPVIGEFVVLVDASIAAPFLVRATLRSLQDQSVREWRAIVCAPQAIRSHPVASFEEVDARIAFVAPGGKPDYLDDAKQVLCINAGTVLDGEAIAWLAFAANRTGSGAVFADHDRGIADPLLGLVRADPWLPGAFDPDHHGESPAVVLANVAVVRAVIVDRIAGSASLQRRVLETAGSVSHVARLLGTRLELPLAARDGKPSDDDGASGRLAPITHQSVRTDTTPVPARPDRIAVVIPTRNSPDLLVRALASLREMARDATRLDIIVVDNGDQSETADIAAAYGAQVLLLQGPFNWSRASNTGAAHSDAPLLLFANDDIEMLTPGWDDRLVDTLASDEVGAVGVRLLYPDHSVQHAGMVFGLGRGHPEHEGRGRPVEDLGPDRRLKARRSVAAVTGAFLGVRRDRFTAVEGFDAAMLFVGHSDVDLCLKLREIGLRIVYLPEIVAIHFESQTRGLDETKAQVAWDEAERLDLWERWGSALTEDPGVSPYWAMGGVPFDGLREPSLREIVRHLDVTASSQPWKPTRRAEQEARSWRADVLI